jgi:hypothetical protein
MDFVRVVGQAGATLGYPSPFPGGPVLNLSSARGIEIKDITVVGDGGLAGVNLVHIFYSTAIRFDGVVIHRGLGTGVFVNQGSTVHFRGCGIDDNGGDGVAVRSGSVANFGDNNDPSAGIVSIRRNGAAGINGGENAHINLYGDVSILDNRVTGLFATASSVRTCCQTGERVLSGNGGSGISVNGGDLRTSGKLTIERNGAHGVNLTSASAQINGDGGQPLVLRNNTYDGIAASSNSTVEIRRALIENNRGYGVETTVSSTALVVNSTIRGNAEQGLALTLLSVAILGSGNVIADNGGMDLFCSPESMALGTKDGIDRVSCRFQK